MPDFIVHVPGYIAKTELRAKEWLHERFRENIALPPGLTIRPFNKGLAMSKETFEKLRDMGIMPSPQ